MLEHGSAVMFQFVELDRITGLGDRFRQRSTNLSYRTSRPSISIRSKAITVAATGAERIDRQAIVPANNGLASDQK